MSTTTLPSLQIAQLLVRKGDLREARSSAEDARQEASILQDCRQWLEATRIFLQCCQELEEISLAQKSMEEVLQFLAEDCKVEMQAQAETLISSWLLALKKTEESQTYAQSAIEKSVQNRDLETLGRALTIFALSLSFKATTYGPCLEQLNKLDVILEEVQNVELQLTSQLIRSFIYSQQKLTDQALTVLWSSYEQAKLHGYHFHIANILAHIARAYRDLRQDDEYQIYAQLALKGLDQKKAPRIYNQIVQALPLPSGRLQSFDFQIDETARRVREKSKGLIDFKNQHILFEMALFFIKNPGIRYSKDDLAKMIWNQIYSPDLHDNLIYVSIKRLRGLLEPDLDSPKYILRDRKGYYFNSQFVVQFKNIEETTP